MGPSTPGSQNLDLPFQTLSQCPSHGLNKSSSSPELQTLPEAFAKVATESETLLADVTRTALDAKPQPQQALFEKDKVEGSTEGDTNGLGGPIQGAEGPGVAPPQIAGARMRLEFPTMAQQPGGHRPRGHTISVSAPSSRRERRTDRDSYNSRPGSGNTEKILGLSPRYFLPH